MKLQDFYLHFQLFALKKIPKFLNVRVGTTEVLVARVMILFSY